MLAILAAASKATAAAATATDAAAVALVLLISIFELQDEGTIIDDGVAVIGLLL